VAKGYRPVDRDQEFLLPPNMINWLPEDHVVWFLIDTVAELDTSVFHQRAARRRDGRERRSAAGRASYDPDMLLTLLLYAYAYGQRSSRAIERLCATDVAFRLICAQDTPDHTVLARFRQTHLEAFAEVFAQVLRLCREAGLVRLGTVAIDGSKIAANASRLANRGADWLDAETARIDAEAAQHDSAQHDSAQHDSAQHDSAQHDSAQHEAADRDAVARILAEAEQVDAAEDTEFGSQARGDELPVGWRRRAERRERIRAARARIEAVETARRAEAEHAAAERAEKDAADLAAAEQALAGEIATREAAREAWEAQWEHAAANPGAPLPRGAAPKPVEQAAAVRRAQRRVEKARERVDHPDTAPRRGRTKTTTAKTTTAKTTTDEDKPARANITDPDSSIMPTKNGGWVQCYNAQVSVSADQIIVATEVSTNPADIVSYQRMVAKTEHAVADLQATDELGTLLFDAGYCSDDTLTASGPDRLIATGKTRSIRKAARDNPTTGPPPEGASPREAMDHRLRTPEGAALYLRRSATVEPAIGNLKKLFDRFCMRGLPAATAELHLAATAFNLLKIYRAPATATT
jgi:transposase